MTNEQELAERKKATRGVTWKGGGRRRGNTKGRGPEAGACLTFARGQSGRKGERANRAECAELERVLHRIGFHTQVRWEERA